MEGRRRSFEGNRRPVFLKSVHPYPVTPDHLHKIEALGTAGLIKGVSTTGIPGSRELVDICRRSWGVTTKAAKWSRGYLPRQEHRQQSQTKPDEVFKVRGRL